MRPALENIPEYYHRYVNQVKENDLMSAFASQREEFTAFLKSIPIEKASHRYAEDKWTIQEMLQHIIDTERIFAYRALCFARMDLTPLPGFEENDYAQNSNAMTRNWSSLIEEFMAVRYSNELLFGSFNEAQLEAMGTANGQRMGVLALGFILVGHVNHHVSVLRERYL